MYHKVKYCYFTAIKLDWQDFNKVLLCEKLLLEIKQSNSFIFSYTVTTCMFNICFVANLASQVEQSIDILPWWTHFLCWVICCINEPVPVWREIGTGFSHMSGEATNVGKRNSSQITNGTFPIVHEWLSRRDEIIIPHERRSREWGIIISSQLLSQEWKIGNVPWVMSEEFYPSLFLSRPELTFPYKKENFNISYPKIWKMHQYS